MKYYNAIDLVQDAVQVLGDTLRYPDVQRKYGFEELRGQVLEDVLYLASECPDQEHEIWKGAMLTFSDLNRQLAALDVAPFALPSFDVFMEQLEGWRLRGGEGTVEEHVAAADQQRDFFETLLDPEIDFAQRANRVIVRMGTIKQRELSKRQPAPVIVEVSANDKPLIESSVRLACQIPSFAHHVFEILIEDLGDRNGWRFDEAATDAWRFFFTEEVTEALIREVA